MNRKDRAVIETLGIAVRAESRALDAFNNTPYGTIGQPDFDRALFDRLHKEWQDAKAAVAPAARDVCRAFGVPTDDRSWEIYRPDQPMPERIP